MMTLVIEASTYAGSVALVNGPQLIGERSVAMRGREREALMPAVAELLDESGMPPAQLERIVCGAGPGSFTSLRIAGGIAKGLALAVGIPLVPVSSLALLVASHAARRTGRYLGAIDALRGEHYVAEFSVTSEGELEAGGGVSRVPSKDLGEFAGHRGLEVVAAGTTMGTAPPHARAAALITKLIDRTSPADLAAWEPAYGRLAEAQVKWEAAHGRSLTEA